MDKNFIKKIKDFKIFLMDNFNIIDNNIIKRNRKIDFKHIIYTCFNKFINHTSYDIEVGELNKHILNISNNITKQGLIKKKIKLIMIYFYN